MPRDELKSAILRFLLGILAQFSMASLSEDSLISVLMPFGFVSNEAELLEALGELRSSALLAESEKIVSLTGLGLLTAASMSLPYPVERALQLASEKVAL